MKPLLAILLLTLTLSVYAADVSVTASVISATDVNAIVKVVVTNTATPVLMNVTATVQYQRWGFDEEAVSLPVAISVNHPVVVKGISLSFPADWINLQPFVPFTLNDGESKELVFEYAKVTIK